MSNTVIRVVPFIVSSAATATTSAIDLDYRFGPTPVRSIFVVKSSASGGAIEMQAAPYSTGPWVTFIQVSSAVTATVIPFQIELPYVRAISPGGGPVVTIYGVI